MTGAARDALVVLAAAELAAPTKPSPAVAAAQALARDIVARHGASVAAILFYGSCRRSGDASGLLDLYVVHDGHRAFHHRLLPALLNAILPPTVLLRRHAMAAGQAVQAKVAVLSRLQFARRLRAGALDTTIWARFCQPATLVYARDLAAERWTAEAMADAVATAALWAVRLGPPRATPAAYWEGLFARTYGAELRVERGARPSLIHAASAAWFDAGLPLGLAMRDVQAKVDPAGILVPAGEVGGRRWRLSWGLRRMLGKVLNVARLVKAAFTFEGGADYLAWKITRHAGVALTLTDWQRRHPICAAPALLWRLWRQGAIR